MSRFAGDEVLYPVVETNAKRLVINGKGETYVLQLLWQGHSG